MNKCFLLLLAGLLLVLHSAAQVPQKAAPDDLMVTAEIVCYSHKSAESAVNNPQLILYVQLNVRNQTNSPREITFYSCGWPTQWIPKGPVVGFDFVGCDKNYPRTILIPVNQSIIFYGPVRVCENDDKLKTFALGFVDFTAADFESKAFRKDKRYDKLLKSKVVYWSNELNGNIAQATTPEIKGFHQYHSYGLTWEEE